MKIAVATNNNEVAEHFGHCETFKLFECENGKVLSTENKPNPGHKPGFLPNFLNELGVNVIISGGMGSGAVEIFSEHEIEVVLGSSGDADAAVNSYLLGELKSTGSICDHSHENIK
ncbi:MAG: NifB/NifX family molybdenum-iron cluster-binding protein [Synergistaceae bacterium]|jgi:predicted Fe-Mo cluster-binding NifX family protein